MFELLFKYSRDVFSRSDVIFASPWPDWVPIALGAIGIAGISWFLLVRRGAARAWQLAVIGAVQCAMLAVVLWVLQQPMLQTEQLRAGENSVALVLDNSSSMAYGDRETRLVDARNLLEAAMGDGGGLALPVQRYAFTDRSRAVDTFAQAMPQGDRTSIANSVIEVLREARRNPLAAVIVASDGADTTVGLTNEELAEIAAFGVPVHTIAVGREAMPEDLELLDVAVPARVLPGTTVSARVTVRHDGSGQTQLKVYEDDALLASTPIELTDGTTTTAWVDFRLNDVGPHVLDFSLDSKADEGELRNNRRVRLVDVQDDQYNVLYLEGEPRWEYKFMRRAVHGDGDLELVSLLRVSPNKFYRQGVVSPEQLADGFPTSAEELYTYDALIIGSIEAASLTLDQQALIRDFVAERGGTLLMLAGRRGLGNGGWGQSPVADALPTRLPQADVDSFFRVHAPVAITPQGADNEMLKLAVDDGENLTAWSGLPAVADYQLTGTLKPAAITLLTSDTEQGVLPLLVTQPFGKGRSYVFATGGTWRWQMSLPVEDERHETFWRQLLRTLVANAPPPSSVTASSRPGAGGIHLRAEFRNPSFAALDDISATAVVANSEGDSWTVELTPADEAGAFVGEVDPQTSGTFFVEAFAESDQTVVSTVRASLAHEASQAEYFGIRSKPNLLGRLSDATGGELLAADQLSELPDLLRYSKAGITEVETRAIWDMPALFLMLIALKFTEWLLRRRWGSI
ncbi:MAG: glutamine amidotransferase [Pseudomonadota bacterium]